MKIKKVIIPAGGLGTRFLPITKAIPKPMLPIIDKPVIQYVVEEAVLSGIKEIIIVTSPENEPAIKSYFTPSPKLENCLKKAGKEAELQQLKNIAKLADFKFLIQPKPLGNGQVVLVAKNEVGNEPFAVLWGDEFIYSRPKPYLEQMMAVAEKFNGPAISAVKVDDEGTKRYGIAEVKKVKDDIFQIMSIVEKPGPELAPSRLAVHCCYILLPEIFTILENLPPGKGGEIWLPEAVDKLIDQMPVYTKEISDGRYYDCGNKTEFLKAQIDFGLRRKEIEPEIKKYLRNLAA